jgi:hypothetical protein
VIYGSLTALGFATLENALYFNRFGLALAYHRYLISAVLHVALTGTVCYIWARARSRRRANPMLAILSGLALAATVHGLFDFFLMGFFAKSSWASIVLLLFMAREYHYVLLKSTKQSAGFEQLLLETSRLESFGLWVSLGAVLLTIAYIYNNFTYSIDYANQELAMLAFSSIPALFGVFGALGEIQLHKRKRVLVRLRASS